MAVEGGDKGIDGDAGNQCVELVSSPRVVHVGSPSRRSSRRSDGLASFREDAEEPVEGSVATSTSPRGREGCRMHGQPARLGHAPRVVRAFWQRQNGALQFSPDLHDRLADGTITVSYRLWSRPKVKVGGVYRSGSVAIQIRPPPQS